MNINLWKKNPKPQKQQQQQQQQQNNNKQTNKQNPQCPGFIFEWDKCSYGKFVS